MTESLEIAGTEITQTVGSRVRPSSRAGELPLSFAQQRLWFLEQLEPGNPIYNIAAVVRMTGLLKVGALEGALNEVVRRHEILRTTFDNVNGRAEQRIMAALRISVPLINLTQLPEAERAVESRRLTDEESKRSFDLACGPLLRASLLQLSAREYVLLLTMRHIVSDSWSLGIFMREMGQLYVAYANMRPSPLGELPMQYADYAIWQQDWLRGDLLEEQVAHWRRQLAGAPVVLELPSDRPRPPALTHRSASLKFELPEALSQALNALSRRGGVTPFMLLFATFVTLLYRYTSQEDILVGAPVANRNRSEIEGLIGLFVNTIALRARPRRRTSFLELLEEVRETTLVAYAHQDTPFEKLVD